MTSVRLSFRSSSDSIRSHSGSEIVRWTKSWYRPAEMTNRTVPIRKISMIETVSAMSDLARGGRHVARPDQVEDDGRDPQQPEDLEGGRRRERAEHGEDDQEPAGSQDVTDHGLPIVPEPTDLPCGCRGRSGRSSTVRAASSALEQASLRGGEFRIGQHPLAVQVRQCLQPVGQRRAGRFDRRRYADGPARRFRSGRRRRGWRMEDPFARRVDPDLSPELLDARLVRLEGRSPASGRPW